MNRATIVLACVVAMVMPAHAGCDGWWSRAKTTKECFSTELAGIDKNSRYELQGNTLHGFIKHASSYRRLTVEKIKGLARNYGQWLQKHPEQPRHDIRVAVKVDLVDQYGNKSEGYVLAIKFAAADLVKMNWGDGFDYVTMMFAEPQLLHPLGAKWLAKYCTEDALDFERESTRFCR